MALTTLIGSDPGSIKTMKFFRRVLYLAVLSLALGIPAHAAPADERPASPRKAPAKPVKRQAAPPASAPAAEPASTLVPAVDQEASPGQVVYQVLLAEIALQRGELELALQAYSNLAQRTRNPQVMERAIEVAGFARRFDVAVQTARLWLEVEPASQRAQRMLASVLILGNQFDDLAPYLVRMLDSDKPALAANLLGLNRMFARNTDRQAVFRLIEKVCQPFFGIAEAHYAVALAASNAGLAERARNEAERALELRPGWEAAAFLQGQILMRQSRPEAVAFMEDFLRRNPEAREVQLSLARALVGERRYADAKRHFDQLLLAYPDNAEVVYSVAILALQLDDKALAEAQLKRFVTFDVQDRSPAYYYLGQIAEEAKRTDDALGYYAHVVSGEHYLPAVIRRAQLLSGVGKLDQGRDLLRNARTDKPEERVQLQIAEAALLRESSRPQEAFDFLERLLAVQSDHPDLMYESALLADRLKRPDVMESRLRRLIELRPDHPQAYNALGYSYADRNERLAEARQLIEKALTMAPDDGAILDSMGWVLFRQGDLNGALTYLERSYGKREDPEIAAHLGEVLWTLGRKDDARRLLLDMQKKYPTNDVLSETVRRLVP